VLVLTYLFANNLSPTPQFVVRTQIKRDRNALQQIDRSELFRVYSVSDDGRLVTIGIHSSDRGGNTTTRLQLWDVPSGTNRTPGQWYSPGWRSLFTRSSAQDTDTGMGRLLFTPSGQQFLRDQAAWDALGQRLGVDWGRMPGSGGRRAPENLRFSSDGRFVAYIVPTDWPAIGFGPEALSKATAVEDVRTGERVATLPAVTNPISVAPGGRRAVWRIQSHKDTYETVLLNGSKTASKTTSNSAGEDPAFVLWDLTTSTACADLWLPLKPLSNAEFTSDGRYVFTGTQWLFRWWDAENGRQIGEVVDPAACKLMDGGRVFVMQFANRDVLSFWDVATGERTPDWELPKPREGTGTIGQLEATGGDRYVAVCFDPDVATKTPTTIPVVEHVVRKLPELPPSKDRGRILVLDVMERRVVGKVPGRSAALSPDGRWLATINDEGIVRVWEMPFGRPWGRGLAYAAGLVFGSWILIVLLVKAWRWWRRRPAEPDALSEGDAAPGQRCIPHAE
jgi:hypothetical protein